MYTIATGRPPARAGTARTVPARRGGLLAMSLPLPRKTTAWPRAGLEAVLTPITRWALQFRRSHHHTPDPGGGQLPGQPVPGRAGLVGHRDRRRQLRQPLRDALECRAHPAPDTSPVTVSNPHPTMDRACTLLSVTPDGVDGIAPDDDEPTTQNASSPPSP